MDWNSEIMLIDIIQSRTSWHSVLQRKRKLTIINIYHVFSKLKPIRLCASENELAKYSYAAQKIESEDHFLEMITF